MSEPGSQRAQPIYQDVADTLIAEVAEGRFAVGSMLPTELELCDRFGVSRYTVREALRQLEEMGLVERRQGSGTVVRAAERAAAFTQTVSSLTELLQYPVGTQLYLDETETLKIDRENAGLLRGEIGEERVRISGVRRVEKSGTPICWSDIYLCPEYAGVTEHIGGSNLSVYALIEREFGEKIEHVSVEMFPSTMPERLAGPLRVEPGTASMTIIRRYTGIGDRVFEVSVSVHPEHRFTYSIELTRSLRFAGKI